MEEQDADDIEYQALVQRHKAEIEASGMSQEELINCHGPIISDTSIGAISLRGQDEHERQKTTPSV